MTWWWYNFVMISNVRMLHFRGVGVKKKTSDNVAHVGPFIHLPGLWCRHWFRLEEGSAWHRNQVSRSETWAADKPKPELGRPLSKTETFAKVYQSADVSDAFSKPAAVTMSILGPNSGPRDILTSCDVSLFLPATAGSYCKSSETEANPSWLRLLEEK